MNVEPATPGNGRSSYEPRIVDGELAARLAATGAVLIEGPKGCGKTATARQVAKSEVLLDTDVQAQEAIAIDPALVLDGDTPRLIDEWQLRPEIWNHVRRSIDDRRDVGQFILTGSATPADDINRHTGAGRITRMRMRPMSTFETGASDGQISLSSLLDNSDSVTGRAETNVTEIARQIAVGGWPAMQGRTTQAALTGMRGYVDEVRRVDISSVDGVSRDPERVGRLIRSLARNVATYTSATTLARDTEGQAAEIKDDTVRSYLHALTQLLVVEDQPAWAPHLRSSHALRQASKRHFVDPSLAVAALRATPEALMQDLKMLGFLFESMVVRDLRIYAQHADAEVAQYRDSDGLEVDAIVHCADGRWMAAEVKLGTGYVDEAAENLKRFARRIDQEATGAPGTLAVIVGSGYGYVRDDGVAVIPIGLLGP